MNNSKIGHFDGDSVAQSLKAAHPYHRTRQVPDPVDRQDCRKRPDLVALAVHQRALRGEEWGSPRIVRSPKLAGGDRVLIVLDPLAEVFFREKGDHLLAIDSELSDNVLHARIASRTGPAWKVRSWHERHPQWDKLKADSRTTSTGSGVLDVKDHYPTILNEALGELLQSRGIPEASVKHLIHDLARLQSLPGIPLGLPVDMELSALLGTAALLPVDIYLLGEQIRFHRWVDDIIISGISEDYFLDASGRISEVLEARGQHLNQKKSQWYGNSEAELLYLVEPPTRMTLEDAIHVLRWAARFHEFNDVPKALGVVEAKFSEYRPRIDCEASDLAVQSTRGIRALFS